jgi:hypothetical protein
MAEMAQQLAAVFAAFASQLNRLHRNGRSDDDTTCGCTGFILNTGLAF